MSMLNLSWGAWTGLGTILAIFTGVGEWVECCSRSPVCITSTKPHSPHTQQALLFPPSICRQVLKPQALWTTPSQSSSSTLLNYIVTVTFAVSIQRQTVLFFPSPLIHPSLLLPPRAISSYLLLHKILSKHYTCYSATDKPLYSDWWPHESNVLCHKTDWSFM